MSENLHPEYIMNLTNHLDYEYAIALPRYNFFIPFSSAAPFGGIMIKNLKSTSCSASFVNNRIYLSSSNDANVLYGAAHFPTQYATFARFITSSYEEDIFEGDEIILGKTDHQGTYRTNWDFFQEGTTVKFPDFISWMPFALADNVQGIRSDSTATKDLYFLLYPSGLVLYLNVIDESEVFNVYFEPTTGRIYGYNVDIQTAKLLSPVPKTYCFLDNNNNTNWQINYSSWRYSSGYGLWEYTLTLIRDNGLYISNDLKGKTSTKLLFIDPMLWDYKDSKTVSADQTEEELAFYPLFKDPSTGLYHINDSSISGTYNFLSSYGAFYQYGEERINLLKDGYVTIQGETGQYQVNNTPPQVIEMSNRKAVPLYQDILHYRFGSMKGKGIIKDNSFNQTSNLFLDNNNPLVQKTIYTADNPYLLYDNIRDSGALLKYNNKPFVIRLDNYHLYIGINNNNSSYQYTTYRISPNNKIAYFTRESNNVTSNNIDTKLFDNSLNEYPFLGPNQGPDRVSGQEIDYLKILAKHSGGSARHVDSETVLAMDPKIIFNQGYTVQNWQLYNAATWSSDDSLSSWWTSSTYTTINDVNCNIELLIQVKASHTFSIFHVNKLYCDFNNFPILSTLPRPSTSNIFNFSHLTYSGSADSVGVARTFNSPNTNPSINAYANNGKSSLLEVDFKLNSIIHGVLPINMNKITLFKNSGDQTTRTYYDDYSTVCDYAIYDSSAGPAGMSIGISSNANKMYECIVIYS